MPPSPAGMDLLTTPPPAVDEALLVDALRVHHAIEARVSALPGERDRNMLVRRPDGSRAVLKLFNAAEPPEARSLARAVLLHLGGRRLPFAVPRLIPARDGAETFAVGGAEAMLTTFVEGRAWDAAPPAAALRAAVGGAAAALSAALGGFGHPALRRSLPWDLMRLDRMAPVAAAMADRRRGDWLAAFLERFAAEVRPAAAALPAGPIHNDLNGANVLVDAGAVAGVIDFGDLLHGPRVAELAVACTYGLGDADPAEAVADFAAGWARAEPLAAAEAEILFDLALARLALRVLMYEWRAAREEGGHATRHAAGAYLALDRAMALPPRRGRDRVVARLRAPGASP
ncbi:phosphotransferase [Lichenibacterium dinghuense]|uniref:phosphotransferase n=1 Tax=Lichenibacterium dinghuense TaxID=2895977 RepID=UPI001F209A10|nr:phosphotransferase [Lichenibacterium sp. 6Y81]